MANLAKTIAFLLAGAAFLLGFATLGHIEELDNLVSGMMSAKLFTQIVGAMLVLGAFAGIAVSYHSRSALFGIICAFLVAFGALALVWPNSLIVDLGITGGRLTLGLMLMLACALFVMLGKLFVTASELAPKTATA